MAASKLVGWGLRTFQGRTRGIMLTLLKSLVQPKLDYCSQLWSPADQLSINKIEAVQRHLVGRFKDNKLNGLSYWEKLTELRLYSQERRQLIFIWKISQGMVAGCDLTFTSGSGRRGRELISTPVVRNARERNLWDRGAILFNLFPVKLRSTC